MNQIYVCTPSIRGFINKIQQNLLLQQTKIKLNINKMFIANAFAYLQGKMFS